jgi:tol-pal system protein YbgF
MVRLVEPPKMSKAMIRSASLLALACSLWATAAQAQLSESDLLTRIGHLEAELRDLTGTVEQLQYRNQQLEQEIQRLQAGAPAGSSTASAPRSAAPNSPPPQQYSSAPYSPAPTAPGQYSPPRAGTAQYPPPTPPYSPPPPQSPAAVASAAPIVAVEPGATPGRRSDAFNPALNPTAPGVPRPLGTSTAATEPPPPMSDAGPAASRQPGAPLDLSAPPGAAPAGVDLPPPPAANPSATGAMQATLTPTLPPGSTPKDEYDLAYGYVLHKDYGPAADTFRDFLHKYPADRLVPEAQYWLGESLFQNQRYRDAAEAFLAVSTKYDTMARAPDALLRLGQSLAALGEKEAACASLGEVLRKYPRASANVKQTVDREQKRVHC